ncbi:MAG: TlpA family protein disulfide reductase [Promethearchaeati archaeon]
MTTTFMGNLSSYTRFDMVDLDDIKSRTVTAKEYIEKMEGKQGDMFLEKYNECTLDPEATKKLAEISDDYVFVVMSAAWCGDCKEMVSALAKLEEEVGLDVRVFGGIKTDPLNKDRQWRIPPSPPEIEKWNVTAIPWVRIFDKKGNQRGAIIEKPRVKDSVEAEILHVLRHK